MPDDGDGGKPESDAGAGGELHAASREPGPKVAPRVLLLEDDPELNAFIQKFLADSGYQVSTAASGVEGIREIMAHDFAVILCDVRMPGLPGDMFYRAVKGISPGLCDKVVFMSGYHADVTVNDFIKSVDARLLLKPFRLTDLLETIASVLARNLPPAEMPPGERRMHILSAGDAAEEDSAPPAATKAPGFAPWARSGFAYAAVGLFLAMVAVLGHWYADSRDRAADAEANLSAWEACWPVVASRLEEGIARRQNIELLLGQPARIAADRARPRWTPALSEVAIAAGGDIEIVELHGRQEPEYPGACEVRVRGAASGPQPRREADRFRMALEGSLKRQAGQHPVSVRFEELEDEPDAPAAGPDQRRAVFVVIATVGSADSSSATTEGGSKKWGSR